MDTQKIPDYYRVLRVSRKATTEDLKLAYIRLAKTRHPDRGGSVAAMQRLNQAYSILRDPERRSTYDRLLSPRKNKLSQEELDDLFVDELFYEKVVNHSANSKRFKLAKSMAAFFVALRRTT